MTTDTDQRQKKELERLRSRARHDEASALGHARREAIRETDEKWKSVIAEKDAEIKILDEKIAILKRSLAKERERDE